MALNALAESRNANLAAQTEVVESGNASLPNRDTKTNLCLSVKLQLVRLLQT